MVMRSTDFRSIVEPILNEVFDGVYDQRADEFKDVFQVVDGTPRQYHEEPVLYGFNAAPELPDGKPVSYDEGGVLFIKRYIYKVFGLAYSMTRTVMEDGDHIRLGSIYAKHLAQSLIETKETRCANVLNYAFTSGYTGGDGIILNSASHPIQGGTFSNLLGTAATLSQTSVEQMCIQIRGAVDNNGKKIRLKPLKLVVSPSQELQAEVVRKSALRTGSGYATYNDINPINSKGMLAEDTAVLSRLTSTTAWWIKTDAPEGLKLMMRTALKKSMEGDFETDSMRYKATERYIEGWTDPRGVFGTPGV
jgi:hypothetical protein